MFVDMSPKNRFKLLYDKGLCYQCLSPGSKTNHGKHKSATCFSKFVCKNKAHSKQSYDILNMKDSFQWDNNGKNNWTEKS